MTTLQNKIDFAVVLRVKRANPNGDPLNGNRPRTDYENFGEMTDVCNKRKIRDRLLERWIADGKKDDGNMIFVQSDDRKADEHTSLRARAEAILGSKLGGVETAKLACEKWFDVRAFAAMTSRPVYGFTFPCVDQLFRRVASEPVRTCGATYVPLLRV